MMTSVRAPACRVSGGAVRKNNPLSATALSSAEVDDGEIEIRPAATIFGMTAFVTLDDDAPMMTCTPRPTNRSTVPAATTASVPSSPSTHSTGWPSTPPAALTSATASLAAAKRGGLR